MENKKNGFKTFICAGCGENVTIRRQASSAKYCSHKCFTSHRKKGYTRGDGSFVNCIICGKKRFVLDSQNKNAKSCSKECFNIYQSRNKVPLKCKVCGEIKMLSPSRFVFDNPKYCSIKCRDKDPEVREMLVGFNTLQRKLKPNNFEKLGYRILEELEISYIREFEVDNRFTVDILIPEEKIIIQLDGDYWHGNEDYFPFLTERQIERKNLDRKQDEYLKNNGYKILRIWQSEFKNIEEVKEKILIAFGDDK